eukprot:Phypoly_transcript_08431.p1 GENE.Phypoly_transcript_08431~~Phypoly_transcript_08431.p1  ORF type:complete len:492 (+),score=59.35 Phypoly_transcript_08431:165-1478(+)
MADQTKGEEFLRGGLFIGEARFVTGTIDQLLMPISGWDGVRWKWEDILWRTGKYYLPQCYACGEPFYPNQLNDTLCERCEEREEEKWKQWDKIDLTGRTALVTGARIKIGYQCALRLLRSGCTVIGVTRFPNDAIRRYSAEPDYGDWKNRLHIYGLDLRSLPNVINFISHISKYHPQIDILINNAAQTIRRPRAYYYSLLQIEKTGAYSRAIKGVGKDPHLQIEFPDKNESALVRNSNNALTISSAFSDVALLPEDAMIRNDELFPPGMVDAHNEQLDLRTETSWGNNIEQISVVEALEVQTINSTVPFMLISQLKPALKAAAKNNGSAYVINVTSAEGDFNFTWRKDAHPHTNMAKAALNMMTKSISVTFALEHIYANAVDTGWVSLMTPASSMDKAPLTERNGATRVLDPIFIGLTEIRGPYGKLFRNYSSIPWV